MPRNPLPLPPLEPLVREHPRAKRVTLRVCPRRGLVVTVPKGWDRAELPLLLARRQGWINAAAARLRAAGVEPGAPPVVPKRVDLAATGEAFDVRAAATHGRAALVRRPGRKDGKDILDLRGDPAKHLDLLRGWLRSHARKRLLPRLEALSGRTGLEFASARFGLQKSRWGSCSARGVVSLNAKLLFLPPEAADYVMLHELAHTRHMNHGPNFRRLMLNLAPDTPALERALRHGWAHVPPWAA